ncbi:MAG: aspartate aminotransferase family protein [Thermodesulfobacteriota bacterium]
MAPMPLPEKGIPAEELLARLRSFKAADAKWHGGRMFGLIYMAGQDVEDVIGRAYATYMFENGLSPLAFPSLLKMETEFISMVTALFGGDGQTVGAMTSGGTESILMAVKAARDWARAERPTPGTPEMVAPVTIHPAWNKAAHYLGLKIKLTPVRGDCRADLEAMKAAITENTIILGATAVTYPHGVVDPIGEIGRLAEEHNLWLHVDACLGGYMLAFLRRLGRDIPPFDFSVPGVRSMSVDIHKYGFTPKGASTVLYRNARLRQFQFFVYTDWPGGVYATPSVSGARPGGSIAAAWAVLHYLGLEGFLEMARKARTATEKLMDGINRIEGLEVISDPEATVFAFTSDRLNIFELGARLKQKGWHIDSQHLPPSLHMTVSPIHEQIADEFLRDLKELAAEVSHVEPDQLSQEAALYGLMGTLPDRQAAKEFALQYLSELYSYKG